jgi:tetratricopeptide (TPR) repeat protein
MAKVYVSSTVADLKDERRTVMEWLVAAGHQPVHSYRPNSETVRESCLEDIAGCDLYVLIMAHRYGFQPLNDNPENLSITQLEFRRASELRIPRIALLRTSVPDIRLTDLLSPRAALVQTFDSEVRNALRPAEFRDDAGLIQGLSTGVQAELDKLKAKRESTQQDMKSDDSQVLRIVATLTRVIDETKAENVNLRGRITELEEQLRAAVSRTITAAEQPDASAAAIGAAEALEAGDTRPAEALLGREEREQAEQIGTPGVDDQQQRSQAAALAREQGALAVGHDIRAALSAYQRAAEYEPQDIWTHVFIGDLNILLGDLRAAMESFSRAHAITTALAQRDPANAQWRTDLAVSCAKLGVLEQGQTIDDRRQHLLRGREILSHLKQQGRLHPQQDSIAWFDKQLAKLP